MGNCMRRSSDTSKKFPSNTSLNSNESTGPVSRGDQDDIVNDNVNDPTCREASLVAPNMKMFTLTELKKATRDFRFDTVLSEDGFGTVFKGWVDDKTYAPTKPGVGIPIAVKKSNPESSQGVGEWQAVVEFLGKFNHPNIVNLLGYCCEESQFIMVSEYMGKGNLEYHLLRKGEEPLSWNTRLKIAIGAAKGLSFLHNSKKSVIYRDVKPSNILLDKEFNAKLSNFELAKFGPVNGDSHVTTRVMGTFGYAAPEYVATGHLYLKSDVYGFGVVLFELLTGHRAVNNNRPSGQQLLVDWAKPSLYNKKKLWKIMDPYLADQYPLHGAFQIAQLIIQCLESEPRTRPSMDKVLDCLLQVNDIPVNAKGIGPSARKC